MDTLHNVMRAISGERKNDSRRDHMTVFREFLDHLDRASKRKAPRKATSGKSKPRRRR